MATRKKINKKPGRGGRIALRIFVALLLTLAIMAGIGFVNASLLRIRRAEVVIPDLPRNFDGKTLLYVSDIDLCGLNTPARAGAVFEQLQSLRPDILVLGGDYNSISLLDKLNQPDNHSIDESKLIEARMDFFYYIGRFQAPMGKYAIASTEDIQSSNLQTVMAQNGVQSIDNSRIDIHAGGDTLWLVGVSGKDSNINDVGRAFTRNDCVVVITEGPDLLPVLLTSEASDSGLWSDMILCGHTHGGQIRLFGHSILSLSDAEQRFISGWNTQSGIPILTSEGMGCEGLNLRLDTEPQVWLITLKCE